MFRTIITLTATSGRELEQFDINNIVLHNFIDEDIYYMIPPPSYNKGPPCQVCRLKNIYMVFDKHPDNRTLN